MPCPKTQLQDPKRTRTHRGRLCEARPPTHWMGLSVGSHPQTKPSRYYWPLPLPGLRTCLELTVPAAPLTPDEGNRGFALSSPAWL